MANTSNFDRNRNGQTAQRFDAGPTIAPRVDVYENEEELLLLVDVPGAIKEGVSVQFAKGELSIEAKRAPESAKLLFGEMEPVDYYRVFAAPRGVDPQRIEAELSNGVLRVRLPKSDATKARRIEVKTS